MSNCCFIENRDSLSNIKVVSGKNKNVLIKNLSESSQNNNSNLIKINSNESVLSNSSAPLPTPTPTFIKKETVCRIRIVESKVVEYTCN